MLRIVLCFLFSCTACLLTAKLLVGRALVPVEQQKPLVSKLELESDTATVQFCASKPVVNAEFKIKNQGDRRLTVTAKEFNCTCYLGRPGNVTVLPGQEETMSLPMSMESLARRGEVQLILYTNDPTQPKVPMYVKVIDRPPLVPVGAVSVMQDE